MDPVAHQDRGRPSRRGPGGGRRELVHVGRSVADRHTGVLLSGRAAGRIHRDQYQSIFQSLKQQAGGVFDALLQKSQSVWSAIGSSLKTALLTAIKDVVTSRVAAMLMNMFVPGSHAQMQQGGMGGSKAGGILGALGVGAAPVFAGAGGSGTGGVGNILFGSGSGTSGLATGGTPPFLASGSAGGDGAGMGAATPAGAGGIFSNGGLAGMLPGLKSLFGFGQNRWTDMGGGRAATGDWIAQYGSIGDKLQALGKSNAAVMAGAGLLMDGLKRGGKLGIAEDAGGGALIGFKYGGPLGALVGAIAGAAAGIVRTFIKSAADKHGRRSNLSTAQTSRISRSSSRSSTPPNPGSGATSIWRSGRHRSAT